jgi:hypothetical protein
VAPIRITARGKTSEATMNVDNLWLFEIADGNFVQAQIYADTAAGRNTAGWDRETRPVLITPTARTPGPGGPAGGLVLAGARSGLRGDGVPSPPCNFRPV